MRNLIFILVLILGLNVRAAGVSNEIAKNILLTETCSEINQKLSRHRNHTNPEPQKSIFKDAYLKAHLAYKTERSEILASGNLQSLIKLNILNSTQAESLIDTCMIERVKAKDAQQAFRSYAGSDSLAFAKLEQHNTYILKILSKKSEITLDLEKHLKNWADAREFNVLVGEDSFNKLTVGKVLARNFDQWGFFFDDEWSSRVLKVSGKKHVKQFYLKLNQGLNVQLSEKAFNEALSAAQLDYGVRLIKEKILGQDNYTVLSEPLKKSDIASQIPMTRYFAKVKIRTTNLNFDFDETMRNLSTVTQLDIEIPRATYESKNKVFNSRLDLSDLLLWEKFNVISGTITKKFVLSDPNWLEVKMVDGKTYVLSSAFVSQIQ